MIELTAREQAIKQYGLEMGAHCALAHGEGVGMAAVHPDCNDCQRLLAKLEDIPPADKRVKPGERVI